MNIAIVGLGLMGGSWAKASTNQFIKKYGFDKDRETLSGALLDDVIEATLTKENAQNCDFILIALRPRAAIEWLSEWAPFLKKGAVISDVCGIKVAIEKAMLEICEQHKLIYAPIHPMAGKEVGGYLNSHKGLYKGASLIISPIFSEIMKNDEKFRAYIKAIGFTSFRVATADEHDAQIAYTSQLAHVVSNAFVCSPRALNHQGYSADSLKDLTRVATMDVDMWTELFLDNKEYLCVEIEGLIEQLQAISEAIRNEETDTLKSLLHEGCQRKKKMYQE